MARSLHVLGADSHELAVPVIETLLREQGSGVTVVLLGDAPAPALSAGAILRRLAADDLDYPGFLDLLFQADHVVSW